MDRLRYLALRAAYGVLGPLELRLTPAGWLLLGALEAAALLGLDTRQSMAFQAFTFLAAALGLCLAWGLAFRPRLRLRRELPRFATAGTPVRYRVRVDNAAGKPEARLSLRECPEGRPPGFAEFAAARGRAADPWLERALGVSRWRVAASGRRASSSFAELADLPAGGGGEAELELSAPRRGLLRLAGVWAGRTDPLGLTRSVRLLARPETLVVLPRRYPLPRLRLPGSRRHQRGGVPLSSSVGNSSEFHSVRDWRPGDPLRRIHWRTLPKTGKLATREFQDEYFVRHALVLDTFQSGGDPELLEEAVSVAASFAAAALTQESLLDLLFVGAEAYRVTAGRGLGGTQRMLEVLAGVEACDRPFSLLRDAVLARRGALSGCILVLLGFDGPRRALLEGLRASGVPVLALCLSARPLPEAEAAGARVLELGRVPEGLARL